GYVFTANLELAKKIGLRTSRRLEFATAKLEARLLEYELYEGTRKNKARGEASGAAQSAEDAPSATGESEPAGSE
ncbi:MAG: hypothetical protein ACK53V_11140, partial [Planctomycetota bacterium]